MRPTRTSLLLACAAALAATLAPVSVTPAAVVADGPGALVRLNAACGQATSCRAKMFYICSTIKNDYFNYTCNTGCEKPKES